MKKFNVLIAIAVLLLASLACQALAGGGGSDAVELPPPSDGMDENPAVPPADGSDDDESADDFEFSFGGESDFPLPDDAKNVMSVSGTVNYQTSLSLDEVMEFYRGVYGDMGYTERDLLTVVSEGVFSMVFDGDPSGQAVVIQGVDLGDGTMNVNLRLEDT